MRKNVQKQLQELISTLCEAILYIIENQNNREEIFDDFIYGIDTVVNTLQNEEFELKREEIYNEILQELFKEIQNLRVKIINKKELIIEGKNICRLLSKLKDEIKREQIKLEIVFLPYKLSMWDSMESIWRVAKEDKRCKCYVIPIPYYDRNKDGSFGEMHYEGVRFPKDIEITSYNDYSLEQRCPDIIYIHNPYDEHNYVTSIHPYFYSYKIKQYTEMLVYVPYCISGFYQNTEEARRNCMHPAIRYVDKIITQNEAHSQLLISEGCPRNKVVALGTPKLDSVYYMKHNPPYIPDEWKEKIKNKKVILINFTLGTILNDEIWIDRYNLYIKSILNLKECAVIYRAHPLMEATLKSMKPHLYDKYIELLNSIQDKSNVIIDTLESSDVALWCSDAMISDYSSLAFKYIATGKPIYMLMLNPKLYNPEQNKYLDKIVLFDYYECYFWIHDKEICINENISLDWYYYMKELSKDSVFKVKSIEVMEFIDLVLNNKDFKKDERIMAMHNSILNSNGKCGEKINDYIIQCVLDN